MCCVPSVGCFLAEAFPSVHSRSLFRSHPPFVRYGPGPQSPRAHMHLHSLQILSNISIHIYIYCIFKYNLHIYLLNITYSFPFHWHSYTSLHSSTLSSTSVLLRIILGRFRGLPLNSCVFSQHFAVCVPPFSIFTFQALTAVFRIWPLFSFHWDLTVNFLSVSHFPTRGKLFCANAYTFPSLFLASDSLCFDLIKLSNDKKVNVIRF